MRAFGLPRRPLTTWTWGRLTPLPIALVVAGAFCGCRRQPDRAPPAAERAQPAAATTAPAPSGLPRLVDLGAGKCIPCKLMAPILEELKSNTVGRLEVQFIDVWKNPDAGAPYAIRMIPTQIFYGAGGKELFRHEGFFSLEDILAKWKELGVELASTNAPATR